MAKEEVKIQDLIDSEIIQLVQICHGLFNANYLSDFNLTAYTNLLRHKFPLLTYGRVMKSCEDVAANPPKHEVKFTPSFLATILQSGQKEFRPLNYAEREISMEEKMKYRQQFLKDLYADFDSYKSGKEMKNIIVWDYVARQLVSAGYAERLPEIKSEQTRGEKSSVIRNTYSKQEGFVKQCFDKMIKNNQHISEVIHSLN